MGWTSYVAMYYKNGEVDVKAEMDRQFVWESEQYSNKVLKSAVKNSVYYAAVERKNKSTGEREVWAAVCLTSKRIVDGMNFAYKDMDETMEPCCYDCPLSILKMLTPTKNESAATWRQKCLEYRNQPKLSDVKIGESIIWTRWDGTEVVLTKMAPAFQFKRPFWYNANDNTYVPANRIDKWVKM